MKRSSLTVDYFPASGIDSSTSRSYLTRRNYRGPSLHENIRGRGDTSFNKISSSSVIAMPKMAAQTEDEIFALPESSDDEDTGSVGLATKVNNTPASNRKAKRKRDEKVPAGGQEKATEIPDRGSKRKKSSPELQSSQPTASQASLFDSLSQSSQGKRQRLAHYGRTNTVDPALELKQKSQEKNVRSKGKGNNKEKARELSIPPELSDAEAGTPQKRKLNRSGKLENVAVYESPKRKSTRGKLQKVDSVPADDTTSGPGALFSVPEASHLEPLSSSNSMGTEPSTVFDTGDSPIFLKKNKKNKTERRKRRGSAASSSSSSSSSGLSDLDSVVSVELSQSQKDDLKNGTTLPTLQPGQAHCPICSTPVDLRRIKPKANKDPSKLTLALQRDFCHRHRISDARDQWSQNNYPTIDWDDLAVRRIPNHTPHIRSILHRKTPSYYLSNLESAIARTKGNKTRLKKHLTEDLPDTVKQGYYGPRGAKLMGQLVTESLAKTLKMQLKADKIVSTAGVSGFVAAVLLPELCCVLVMEDMGMDLTTTGEEREILEQRARRIMEESTDVGLLLCPDDDHVERRDDLD